MSNFKNHDFVFYLWLVGSLLVLVVSFCLSTFNHYRNGEGAPHERREENAAQPKREERDRVKWRSTFLFLGGGAGLPRSFGEVILGPLLLLVALPSLFPCGIAFLVFSYFFLFFSKHKMLNHHGKGGGENTAPPKRREEKATVGEGKVAPPKRRFSPPLLFLFFFLFFLSSFLFQSPVGVTLREL